MAIRGRRTLGRIADGIRSRVRWMAGGLRSRWRWAVAIALLVAAVMVTAAWIADEPLRRYMERELNDRLTGYTVRIERLDFHPVGASLDLEGVSLVQDANPDPPVAVLPRLSASVQWREIFAGRLVANFSVERPTVYVNRAHLAKELSDDVDVKERGWQEALQAIYPLKINEFKITEATLTYIDDPAFPPLHLSHVTVRARNIRNIRAAERTYPSTIEASAVVFGTGRASIVGHADFLATPHLGVTAEIALDAVALDAFAPVVKRYGVALRGGVVSAAGVVEYAPAVKVVELAEATVTGLRADYIRSGPARQRAEAAVRKGAALAREVTGDPETLVRVAQFRLVDGELGFVNRERAPGYRIFLAAAQGSVRNLSNHGEAGEAVAVLSGRFMGTGRTQLKARFRPVPRSSDFGVELEIENTDLPSLNDLLRTYGKFDVVGGLFSLYAEVRVKGDRIRGYVKPLLRDVKAHDPAQDREKSGLRRAYERIVEGASRLLQNRPREEVATRVDLSGRVENPEAGALAAAGRLVQNAFFRAILPGLEGPRRAGGDSRS